MQVSKSFKRLIFLELSIPGILEIKSWFKIGEVEQLFKRYFGLNAQIFRLENDRWRQTTKSDNLSLHMQPEIAMKKKI